MQLAIAIAGSGWNGQQAREMFDRFDEAKRYLAEQIEGEEQPSGEPKPQIALSEEEFRRQVGA